MKPELDSYDWRPITFEGQELPPTLMGLSILIDAAVLSEGIKDWIWKLRHCCGCTKQMAATACLNAAEQTRDYLLTHRQSVMDQIVERLAPHSFEPGTTYGDWMVSLTHIIETARSMEGVCRWSAPSHPRDSVGSQADAEAFLRNLDAVGGRAEQEPNTIPDGIRQPADGSPKPSV